MIAIALPAVMRSLAASWRFALAITEYELRSRHQGSVLGPLWLVLRPFVHVLVYVSLTSFLFQAALAKTGGVFAYVLAVLPALMIWQIVSRCLEESSSIVRDRMEILKQVAYPIETLPTSCIVSSMIGPLVGLSVWALLALFTGNLHLSILALPLAFALLAAFLVGACWLCMLVGAVFKDIREILGLLMGVGIYATPALLTEQMVSPAFWKIILLNPLSHTIIPFRDVFTGQFHPISWLIFSAMAFTAFTLGAIAIHKAKTVINEYL
jgi:lipopolysaccharide transport system permease protein